MRYLGGKTRLAPYIIPIIESFRTSKDQPYIEPFCGGCNVIDKIEGPRIAIDNCEYLIAMWKALQEGWRPPNVSEQVYKYVQNNKERYPKHVVGFVGYAGSFGGKWFAGYARRRDKARNYIKETRNVLLRQIHRMQDVKFHCLDALTLTNFSQPSLIYCDPPYERTTKYKGGFNHEKFWEWCKQLRAKGHTLLVSEKQAPEGWECIFEKATNNDLNSKTLIERLWKLK